MMRERGHLLYRKVYRTLRGRILSGEYAPGARIETETELTRQCKASIITIRQAQQMLVEEGLLVKRQGLGTFVPVTVRNHLKILGVCGLGIAQGLQHRMGPYFSDLLLLSQLEAARRGVEFETAWLPTNDPERARRYCDDTTIREYRAFLFFACSPRHLLLERVREMGLSYAVITAHGHADELRQVRLDYPQAIRLALGRFDRRKKSPLLIMGIESLREMVEAALRETGQHAVPCYLAGEERLFTFEYGGYRRMLELIEAGQNVSRILFLDDVVAQGATRALLKAGMREKDVELVVIGGQQEVAPLGYPATFVTHDAQAEVAHAFDILESKPAEHAGEDLSWLSPFRTVPGV